MSTLDLSKHLYRDLDKVLFENGKHMSQLKEREGYKPDLKSFSEEEWHYLIYALRDAYVSGAERVCMELNKRADAEVKQAQRKAEDKIYQELADIIL